MEIEHVADGLGRLRESVLTAGNIQNRQIAALVPYEAGVDPTRDLRPHTSGMSHLDDRIPRELSNLLDRHAIFDGRAAVDTERLLIRQRIAQSPQGGVGAGFNVGWRNFHRGARRSVRCDTFPCGRV